MTKALGSMGCMCVCVCVCVGIMEGSQIDKKIALNQLLS